MSITVQRNLNYFNVLDFNNVDPTGSTDSTIGITAAITAANAAGGGVVFFPQGTYITQQQTLYSKVHLKGTGISATIIKLKNAQNTDLLVGSVNGYGGTMTNIGAANASGSAGGITDFSITDLTLDGNRANQTSGTGVILRFYGYGFILAHMNMRNGYAGGLVCDWNGGSSLGTQGSTTNDQPFAFVSGVKCHNHGGIGVQWAGPHDSIWEDFYSFFNDSHSYQIGPNSPGILANNCHGFGPKTATNSINWLIESGYNQLTGCTAEGSDAVQVAFLASTNIWSGGHVYQISGFSSSGIQLGQVATAVLKSAATASPIVLTNAPTTVSTGGAFLQFVVSGASGFNGTIVLSGGTNLAGGTIGETITVTANGTYTSTLSYVGTPTITVNTITGYSITVNGLPVPYNGSVFQSGGVATAAAVASNFIESMITRVEGTNGALWFLNDSGNNWLDCNIYLTAGSFTAGTINVLTNYLIRAGGTISPTGTLATSGGSRLTMNATNAFIVNNKTSDIFNVNAFSKFLQLPNGMGIRTYSDNYTTRGVEINNGTISVLQSTSAAAIGTGNTITTSGVGIARVAPTANVTGIILQSGSQAGQHVIVRNESAFTVTFDVVGTSHVADGTTSAIPANCSREFEWNSVGAVWSRMA